MKKRRAFFFGGPVGASLLIALIPGPCTTFDDVTPPGVDASELDGEPIADAGPYFAQCGLVLNFADGANDQDCQRRLDHGNAGVGGCCRQETSCADSGGCASWVACVNENCAPGAGDNAACRLACPKPDASLIEQQITAVSNCGVSTFGEAGCLWP